MNSVLGEDNVKGAYLERVGQRRHSYKQDLKFALTFHIVFGVPVSITVVVLASPILVYQGRSDELVETFIGIGLCPIICLPMSLLYLSLLFGRDLRSLKTAWRNREYLDSDESFCLYLRDEVGSQGVPMVPLPGGGIMDSPWRPSLVGIKCCLRPFRIPLVGLWMPCDGVAMPCFAPVYSTQAAWSDDVKKLMDCSVVIILDVYKSGSGIVWESEHILNSGHAAKTLYIRTNPNTDFPSDLDRRLVQDCAWSMNVAEENRLPRGRRIYALPKDFTAHLASEISKHIG